MHRARRLAKQRHIPQLSKEGSLVFSNMGLLVEPIRQMSFAQTGLAVHDGALGLESTPMSTTTQTRVTPRDVARILFRHWRMMALIFCSVIGLALILIAVWPRSYASEAKLMIRVGRESVGLDPTATTGQTIMLQKSQEDEVNSALNILTSREVFVRVADRVGAKRILDDLPSGESPSTAGETSGGVLAWISDTLVALRLSDPGAEIDRAVRQLEGKSRVTTPKQSMVISIIYKAKSPELAHDVVQAMADVFLEEHSRLSHVDGSLEFFSEQVEKLHKDLSAAQEKLRDRKNAYRLTSLENRRSVLEQGQDALRKKVYELKSLESDLMSRYTDEYPPLKEVRRQRELAEQMLVELPHTPLLAKGSSQQDPAGPEQVEPGSAARQSSDDEGAKRQEKLNEELQTLNDQEYELARLELEVNLLQTKYAMHVEKLEQARVNDALGRERITNVKVAQPASLVYKPVSPKKLLVMAAALLLAVVGSVGFAFAAEALDQTLRTTGQVETQLGVPVLASLPYRKRHRKETAATPARPTAAATNGKHASHNGSHQNGSHRNSNYRALVTALRPAGEGGKPHAKTIVVVGCGASKSRSRVARNVALEAAAAGSEAVLLIDADSRRRRIARKFHLNGGSGWREVLSGTAVAESCVQRSEPGNLAVMGPGGLNGKTKSAESGPKPLGQLEQVKSNYGLVVVDLPPASELDGVPAFDDWIDEAVLVVEAERTRVQAAQRVKEMLNLAGVHVAGVVLANRREYIPRWLYQRL